MSNIDLSLLPDFIVEAEEHLEEMEALLLRLVQQPDDLEVLNDIFRPIHTIKGGAQYIGLEKISQLAHRLEDLLDLLREGSRASSNEIVETLISATDRIKLLVGELENNQTEESGVDELVARLTEWIDGPGVAPDSSPQENAAQAPGQVVPMASASPYASDDDEELFSIFEAHLQEQFTELTALLSQISSSGDVVTVLEQSLAVLEQMGSSANYMDYVDLVQRYQIWKNDLETALLYARSGEPVVLDSMQLLNSSIIQTIVVAGKVSLLPLMERLLSQVQYQLSEHGCLKKVINLCSIQMSSSLKSKISVND